MNYQQSLFDASVNEPSLTIAYNKNKGNQALLNENRPHFSGQTKWILDQLLSGRKISGLIAAKEFNIQDVRARIYTLKKVLDLNISEEKIIGGHGAKNWHMTAEDIEFNKTKLNIT